MADNSLKTDLGKALSKGTKLEYMEKLLFMFSSCCVLLVLVSNFILYCYYGLGPRMVGVKGSAFLLTLILVFVAGRTKAYGMCYTILCFLLSIVILPVTFIRAGGFKSGAPVYMIMCFLMCGCHIDRVMRLLTTGVALVFYAMVCFLTLRYPQLVYNLPEEAVVPEIILAFYLCSVAVVFVTSMFLNSCSNAYKKNLRDYEQKTEMRMALLESQVENIEDVKRQRHNMRHHSQIIQSYAEKKDLKGLRRYLQEKQYSDEFYSKKLYCMNMDVNNILTIYSKMAEHKGIIMNIHADVKNPITIDEKEFTNMLSTVVENAINGAESSGKSDKLVTLDIREKGPRLVIRCENTCSDDISSMDQFPGIPGNGIEAIRRTLEDNGGILDYNVDNGKVSCLVIVDAFR